MAAGDVSGACALKEWHTRGMLCSVLCCGCDSQTHAQEGCHCGLAIQDAGAHEPERKTGGNLSPVNGDSAPMEGFVLR